MSDCLTRVLFVDDDTSALQRMEQTLRPLSGRWEMDFVSSGSKALDAFAKRPFDVIVADMNMSDMDGAALLDEVNRRHPAAVRIILSGPSEPKAVIRTAGVSHQLLAKPCDTDILVSKVDTAMQLRSIMGNERLQSFVAGLQG